MKKLGLVLLLVGLISLVSIQGTAWAVPITPTLVPSLILVDGSRDADAQVSVRMEFMNYFSPFTINFQVNDGPATVLNIPTGYINTILGSWDGGSKISFTGLDGSAPSLISTSNWFPGGSAQAPTNLAEYWGTVTLGWGLARFEVVTATSGGDGYALSHTPIPGAVWLLGSGIIGLVALRRKISF